MKSEKDRAYEKAQSDWNDQNICILHYGDINSKYPIIHKSGLYLRVSWEKEFVKYYNRAVFKFIKELGLPSWAPIKRLPKKEDISNLLKNARLISEINPETVKEKRLINTILHLWTEEYGFPPTIYKKDLNKQLIIIAGNAKLLNEDIGRTDILDINKYVWMYTYEFKIDDWNDSGIPKIIKQLAGGRSGK